MPRPAILLLALSLTACTSSPRTPPTDPAAPRPDGEVRAPVQPPGIRTAGSARDRARTRRTLPYGAVGALTVETAPPPPGATR